MTVHNNATWFVYVLRCNDDSLYTGVTTDLSRRVQEHNRAKTGAKYTKARRPVKLVYSEKALSRAAAQTRESELKRMNHSQKLKLVQST